MRRLANLLIVLLLVVLARLAYDRFWRAPGVGKLDRLRTEGRHLDERLQKHLTDEIRLFDAPDATVLIGIPARLAERFAREVSAGLLSEVTLTVRDLDIQKAGELRAKLLVGRTELGRYRLEVRLDEVTGVLRAGRPDLRFEGRRVGVTLPVSVASGSGRGRFRFSWDGRGMAGAVCGDLEIEGPVTGTVAPDTHALRGGFVLATDGAALVARPEIDDVPLGLRLQPSDETWRLVATFIERQGAVCRTALRAADIPRKLQEALDRGVPVTLPRDLLPELRLPVEMEPSVDLDGTPVHLRIRPAGLSLTRTQLWYGADVRIVETAAASTIEPIPAEATPAPASEADRLAEPPIDEAAE